jgi:citrate lyase subunit beta / citryl-CoA lyase
MEFIMSDIASQTNDYAELLEFGWNITEESFGDEERSVGRIRAQPLRSILYVPGNRRDWIQKCHRFSADGIVLDLEDSVPIAERDNARKIIADEIGPLASRVRSVWVRVNAESKSLTDDLEAAMRPGISVIQLPKVYSAEAVADLDRKLGYFEGCKGIPFGATVIAPILETARGIQHAYDIALSSPRVEYLGAVVAPEGDTARALRMAVMHDAIGSESLYVRGKVVVDARAAGVQNVIGGTVTDLDPKHELLRSFSLMNKAMGYSGSLLIHPDQVMVANELFGQSADNINEALKVLRLLRASPGRAAVRDVISGRMIDLAHGRHAYWVLSGATEFGQRLSNPAQQAESDKGAR